MRSEPTKETDMEMLCQAPQQRDADSANAANQQFYATEPLVDVLLRFKQRLLHLFVCEHLADRSLRVR